MSEDIEKPDMKVLLSQVPGMAAVGFPLPDGWRTPRVTVTTESGSCHLVDMTQGRYRRLRSPHDPMASDLRQDGESVELLAATLPVVGQPWTIWITGLNPLADGTKRTTTLVTEIEWLDDQPAG